MNPLFALFRKINRLFAEVSGYLVAVIVILLLIDTFGYLVRFQVPMMIEMAVFTTIASAYLGLAYTEEKRGHVRVDALLARLPESMQRRMDIIWGAVNLIIIAFTAYAAYLKAAEAVADGESISGEIPLPLAPIRSVIAVSVALYAIQVLLNLIIDIRRRNEEKD